MLKFATEYADQLIAVDRAHWMDEDKKWYYLSYLSPIKVENDDWNNIQMVSVDDNDEVIGYFATNVYQQISSLSDLCAINYKEKGNTCFSRDFYNFLYYLFIKRGFNRLEWSVIIGNPIEKMYDRFCKKVNGNIIGICHRSEILIDRTIVDKKLYEVFREGILEYIQKKKIIMG